MIAGHSTPLLQTSHSAWAVEHNYMQKKVMELDCQIPLIKVSGQSLSNSPITCLDQDPKQMLKKSRF